MENTKICSSCHDSKSLIEFSLFTAAKDGHQAYCKKCATDNLKIWQQKNLEKRQQYQKQYQADHKEFYYQQGVLYRETHVEKILEVRRSYAAANPERCMLYDAKKRARKRNVPLTIKHTDIVIPEFCPILGIKLERNLNGGKPLDSSPALDAIIPDKGYTPENIAVISHRANRIKTDASLEELEKVIEWLRKVTQE
jgi:hypothetical protein